MAALTAVKTAAGPYPTRLLEREGSALLLFGAAFLGANDGIHIRDAGMYATVVDTDEQRLAEMRELYPATWVFVHDDAIEYAARARDKSFDIVSVDCYTGNASRLCLSMAPEWARLARRVVVVTAGRGDLDEPFAPPDGWRSWVMRRTPLAQWLVMERK